jgi:branched-chain amino acid transport system ATP-binding protein
MMEQTNGNGAGSGLQVRDLCVAYQGAQVVTQLSFNVSNDEVLVILGRNGAGKTSTVRTVAGFVRPEAGTLSYNGKEIGGLNSWDIARLGIAFVPEAAGVFPSLSVVDNLRMWFRRDARRRSDIVANIDAAFELFPALASRRKQHAGTLSGGEQRMLALSRVLVQAPNLVIVDEPSLGLAPNLIDQVYAALTLIQKKQVGLIVVEQFVDRALAFGTNALVLERGVPVWSGKASELSIDTLENIYLGQE